MSKNAIELRHVSRSFGDFGISDLNLTLPSGCILGLMGENGAGKSTTIRLLMDTLRRDSGEIFVLGVDNTAPEFQRVKQDIGVVLDEARFPETLNARELEQVLALTYTGWESDTFRRYMDRFRLPEKKLFKDFSRGMKMKLAIAAALSHRARLLILDEATAGLDPIVRDEVVEVFREFVCDDDHSILICSHIVSDLEKLCDYAAFLHRGRLLFCEEKDALLERCGLLSCTAGQLAELEPSAVLGSVRSPYGAVALVRRDGVPAGFELEKPTLEDIILFQVKGENHA